MAIYVDLPIWKLGRMKMCHMTADSLVELHAMANRLGLKRSYFQLRSLPHYDICKSKRKLAIELGAIEVPSKRVVEIAKKLKEVTTDEH